MARPHPSATISFQDGAPPSRRAARDDIPPRPPAKGFGSKSELSSSSSTNVVRAPALGYEEGYIDVATNNPQGFSANNGADVRRKKSMVRPERERIDPGHRLWHYREHAAEDRLNVQPSSTGNQPYNYGATRSGGANLRRGKSLLARDEDEVENSSGLNIFKRGATLRRKTTQARNRSGPSATQSNRVAIPDDAGCCSCLGDIAPGPKDAWMVYCFLLTCLVPAFVLRTVFGKKTREAQRAWREKMGIVGICAGLMAVVGFLTFGFTQTVCGKTVGRVKGGQANNGSLVINGYNYDLATWKHPAIAPYFDGNTSPLYMDQWMAGGKDASFLFQNVNENCLGLITTVSGSGIKNESDYLGWYFPCNLHDQNSTSGTNKTGYGSAVNCHTTNTARNALKARGKQAQIYYTWEQVKNPNRNLVVWQGSVLDLGLLNWLDTSQVKYPSYFDTIKTRNATFAGKDITALMERTKTTHYAKCLNDIVQVGFVDSISIGCVASDVVLYVSLVFILGAVGIKFVMALIFGWFISWRLGNFERETYQQRMKRAAEVEAWTDDIYKAAPGYMRPNAAKQQGGGGARKTVFLPTSSRYSKADPMLVTTSRPTTTYGALDGRSRQASMYGTNLAVPSSPAIRNSRSSTSLPFRSESHYSLDQMSNAQNLSGCPWPLGNVVPQPAPDFEPFQFPLVYSFCLVTAYSESVEGLRTTLDSLATTDYPNSHKLLLVICDGMVRGSGSKQFTPDIVLGMMRELVVPAEEVQAHSYVAIADGQKRHNMAKVYSGFYAYDSETVEPSKQQRVPMILVAKTGNPLERTDPKPGNRGKRDSQVLLMSFLQKVMFDERMTTFEYEFFNAIWRCTGITPDKFETVLCVDADTKVFPDSLTRMNACMVNDTEIMGLCGETKIANKSETWVTMIQVFEYYISHHLTKGFEACFGGVTCLPGCFSMYRIKAPKGDRGYWVPILANPDVVEHYSENVVDTLHKKNLLLLGEDRYLSTLMLKTFPKRKMVFCPQAVCKTIVPDTFRILLSQRRRWINSTVHNLFELMLVRDLCGTFCFSMQFVVFMDLVGTLVLPAAISFTLYILAITIIPKSVTGLNKPIVSLILLAFILGLPGVLIVITSRKVVYVGWMCLYLVSIPIWNLVLPAYAYWHMDDFSWGETRKVAGESKDSSHGDKEGEFDSSHIIMKRWVDFRREEMWRDGTTSRDSQLFDVLQRSHSPKSGIPSNRYSMVSTSETFNSALQTYESNNSGAPFRQSQSFASMSQQNSPLRDSDTAGISQLALPPARGGGPQVPGRESSPVSSESTSRNHSREGRLEYRSNDEPSTFSHSSGYASYPISGNEDEQPILPPNFPTTSSAANRPVLLPPISTNLSSGSSGSEQYFGHQGQALGYYSNFAAEPEEMSAHPTPISQNPTPSSRTGPRPPSSHGRGVSLVDTGPVTNGQEPMRRVSRQHRRSSSRNHHMSPASSSTHQTTLPPGAAPPSH